MTDWTLNRRRFLEVVGLGAAGLATACGTEPRTTPANDATDMSSGDTTADASDATADADTASPVAPYNVLLIVVDQERYHRSLPSDLELPGHARVAANGLTFRKHYTNAMPCTPSRSVMYTGHHVQNTKMRSNIGFADQGNMPTSLPTLGTLLKDRGYRTAYFGKWHLSEIDSGEDCGAPTFAALAAYGFDEFNECGDLQGTVRSGNSDDPTTAAVANAWLRARKADAADAAPWCLAVNFVNPHDIMFFYPGGLGTGNFGFAAPTDPLYTTRYDVTLPASAREDLSNRPSAQQAYKQLYDQLQSYPDDAVGDALLTRFINYYYTCIADVDRHIVTVLDALEASGQADRTIVVLTSDHGEMAQVHGLRGKGPFVYEENNHVPLVIAHPDFAGGRTTDALTTHADLTPTILSLVGQSREATAAKSPGLAGLDLSVLLTDPAAASPRTGVLMTCDFMGLMDVPGANDLVTANLNDVRSYLRGIFDGRYKFARLFAVRDYRTPADWAELVGRNDLECYDTVTDPDELNNLGADPEANRSLLESLWQKLEALILAEAGGDFPPET